jgi:hypothetical protein
MVSLGSVVECFGSIDAGCDRVIGTSEGSRITAAGCSDKPDTMYGELLSRVFDFQLYPLEE